MKFIDKSSLFARWHKAQEELAYLESIFEDCESLLDIGCGLAITTIELAVRHPMKLILMDGYVGPKATGYSESVVPWQRMELTKDLAELNGVRFQTVSPDPTVKLDQVDGVVSLQSWGHHYPVNRYLALVLRSLRVGGPLVIDLRRNMDGLNELVDSGHFEIIGKLDETPRLERFHLRRKCD